MLSQVVPGPHWFATAWHVDGLVGLEEVGVVDVGSPDVGVDVVGVMVVGVVDMGHSSPNFVVSKLPN
jgi:hypothetical protein